jgi:hypothetical protein
MRGKLDIRSGSWPAWWLMNRPGAAKWPKEGEADMMEFYSGKCLFNVFDGAGKQASNTTRLNKLGGETKWGSQFHVWTMDWDTKQIDLYLDGALMLHYPLEKASGTGVKGVNPWQHPETKKMIFNQAIGGACGGSFKPEDLPMEFRVDWVRVHTWSEEPAYSLTVNGGSGSAPYVEGTRVSINANIAPDGYTFEKWESNVPSLIFDAPSSPTATFLMPRSDVTVVATYTAKK